MDLPTLFNQPSADSSEKFYLAIQLAETFLQSALWKISGKDITLVQRSEVHDFTDEKDCLIKTDESLQELGKESEKVNEVVFGLPPGWVEADGIAQAKKPLLKKITDELSLTAVGFVVTTEAVLQDLLHQNPQLSALFVNITSSTIGVSLINQGKMTKTEKIGKSGETIADMTEALARLKTVADPAASLPSKVFFFSADLSEEDVITEEQTFIDYDWVTEGWFLHPPVAETLKSSHIIESIVKQGGKAVAAGSDMGGAAASTEAAKPGATTDFGFDEVTFPDDEARGKIERAVPDENVQPVSAKSFGIPFAATQAGAAAAPVAAAAAVTSPLAKGETAEPSSASSTTGKPSPFSKFKLPSFSGLLKKAKAEEKQIAHHPFIAAGVILGLIALIGGGFLYLKMTSTAEIAVQLKSVPVAKDVSIILDTQSSTVDVAKLSLPARVTSKDLSDTEAVPTTGVKLVGEKAKGKVTVFNKTTSSKVFGAGTILTSGKYQFTLDQEVTVASASVATNGGGETKTYGKTETTVTAAAIGADSNLAKETEFKIASFDPGTYSASVLENLGGGSSREVRVVAEVDRTKALTQLKAKLLKQAETEFKQSSGNGTYTVPTGRMVIKDSKYDAKVGDEAENLSLEMMATIEGATYQSTDLAPLAQAILQSEIPAGYELASGEPTILSAPDSAASPSATVKLQANLSSQAKPKVSAEVWQQEVAGLSLKAAEEKLKSKPEVASLSIQLMPKIAQTLVRSLPAAAKIRFIFN
jgi:hypothetical protein